MIVSRLITHCVETLAAFRLLIESTSICDDTNNCAVHGNLPILG